MAKEEGKLLSNKEWKLMNAVWKACEANRNATLSEIAQSLDKAGAWNISTVKTMLERLVGKGVLKSSIRGRTCFYEPVTDKNRIAKRDISVRLNTILDNTFGPLVAYLAEKKGMTEQQISQLKRLLDENGKE